MKNAKNIKIIENIETADINEAEKDSKKKRLVELVPPEPKVITKAKAKVKESVPEKQVKKDNSKIEFGELEKEVFKSMTDIVDIMEKFQDEPKTAAKKLSEYLSMNKEKITKNMKSVKQKGEKLDPENKIAYEKQMREKFAEYTNRMANLTLKLLQDEDFSKSMEELNAIMDEK